MKAKEERKEQEPLLPQVLTWQLILLSFSTQNEERLQGFGNEH